ncbi:MAG: SAM-dependent methyltransferase [Bacteroidetes bacterium]|jgi:2-polyprenyl-3-methyl-5-hydroxy-6-metoxy-1,4-benzoquinol methylase|nr:SAM-dependent methyltransferase [Bacteroidota bacterium]
MVNENCPSCGSKHYKILYDLTNPTVHKGLGLAGIVKKCNECKLQFKTFENKAEDLYNDNYADNFLKTEEYSGTHAIDFFEKIIVKSFNRLKKNGKPTLLDIGSGIGIMLDTAKKTGYEPTGIELSQKLAEVARKKGHEVMVTNINDSTLDRKFDTISMMDIIEHLEDPKQILQSLKTLLKENGELIVYTPNHDSMIVKIAHLFWSLGVKSPIENIYACTHTCFFTSKTLKDILVRSGYTITEVNHFNYDTSRPGQEVSTIAKIGINIIESIGSLIGCKGFRVVIYAKL